jgi:hypothetical protein
MTGLFSTKLHSYPKSRRIMANQADSVGTYVSSEERRVGSGGASSWRKSKVLNMRS